MRALTLPDYLALSRILAVPVIMYLTVSGEERPGVRMMGGILCVVASFTDLLDGYLARRWGITTLLGAFLDTTADKLLVSGVLIGLVARDGRLWMWAAIIMIGRELLVMSVRGLAAMDGNFIPPSVWGKYKATLQYVALPLAIVAYRPWGLALDGWMMAIATLVTVVSGWDYLRGLWRLVEGQGAARGV